MEEEMVNKWKKLNITSEEENVVDLSNVHSAKDCEELKLALVGRLINDKSVNIEAFKKTMVGSWRLRKGVMIRVIENGCYMFHFQDMRDREKVLEGRPWSFDNHLCLIEVVDESFCPDKFVYTLSPFWVRLYGLPFGYRSGEGLEKLVSTIGKVMEIEKDGYLWDRSRRVKVMMDISKPVRRLINFKGSDEIMKTVELKYEKLPNLCFACGRIGHHDRNCNFVEEGDMKLSHGWGTWLTASPRKVRDKNYEEDMARNVVRRLVLSNNMGKSEKDREMSGGETVNKIASEEVGDERKSDKVGGEKGLSAKKMEGKEADLVNQASVRVSKKREEDQAESIATSGNTGVSGSSKCWGRTKGSINKMKRGVRSSGIASSGGKCQGGLKELGKRKNGDAESVENEVKCSVRKKTKGEAEGMLIDITLVGPHDEPHQSS